MKIDTLLSGTDLTVLLTVVDPATDVAVDPTSAVATFYQATATGLALYPAIPAIALAQIIEGVWGGVADVSGGTVTNAVVVVRAVVGGAIRTAVLALGTSSVRALVGGPRITVTTGPQVDSEKP